MKPNGNVWLREHARRKLNQRFQWIKEMEYKGYAPQEWLDEIEENARLNAGHEPDDLSIPNHSR